MSGIVTAVMVAALGALAAAWLAAVMCEHGMHPLRKMLDALRRPAIERAILAAVAVGFIHHGATKGTNGVNQLPPAPPPMMDMEGPQPGSGMVPCGGGTMTWEIPNVWIPAATYMPGVSERMFLLHYQTFTITADGTVSVNKFGNTVTRTTNDNITVNGVLVQ